jgi:hypothetical protein
MNPSDRGLGRSLQTPQTFADDDGSPSPGLVAALQQRATDVEGTERVITELARARLLVPVVAVLESIDDSGADKSSHMATVTLVQADGRRGLLAFSCLEALTAWDPEARPVPSMAASVAAAAIEQGAQGVLLDIAGPIRFAIDGDHLAFLAALASPTQ